MYTSIHESHQTNLGYNRMLGNDLQNALVSVSKNNTVIGIDIEQRWVTSLNEKGRECNEANTERLRICLDHYIDSNMGCVLPWRPNATAAGMKCFTLCNKNVHIIWITMPRVFREETL